MKTSIQIIAIVILACVHGAESVSAQEWKVDKRLWFSEYSSDRHHGMGRRIARDVCNNELWAVIGSRIWRSADEGLSWQHVPFPLGADRMVREEILIRDCKVLFHYGTLQPAQSFRLAAFDRSAATWRELHPLGEGVESTQHPIVGMINSSIIVSNFLYEGGLFISDDVGYTWEKADVNRAPWSGTAESMFEVSPNVVAIRQGVGFVEYDRVATSIQQVNTPPNTSAYRYTDYNTLVSCQNDFTTGGISFSTNHGNTWQGIQSVSCSNTGLVLSSERNELMCTAMRGFGGVITLFTKNGPVVTTTNSGQTWIDRGTVDPMNFDHASGTFDMDDQGNTIVATEHAVWVVPHGTEPLMQINSGSPRLQTVVRVDNCTYVGIGYDGIFRSSDCGANWYQPASPDDLIESSTLHESGVHLQWIDRIAVRGNDILVSAPEHRALYSLRDFEDARYVAPCDAYSGDPYDEETAKRIRRGAYLVQLRGDTLFDYANNLDVYFDVGNTKQVSRSYGQYASALSVSDDEWIVVARNIGISDDKGLTWSYTAGQGLPRNAAGYIDNASQIIRIGPSTLLLGLRGIHSVANGDTTVLVPGGLYRSNDNGQRWSIDSGLGVDSYVWSIAKLDDNTVLCTSGEVFYDKATESYEQTNAAVMRSVNSGRSWASVHNESRTQPAHPGRRSFHATSPTHVLYASIEDGILESIDAGRTWKRLGDAGLHLRCINDINIDRQGRVYAATDKGLFVYSQTTNVDLSEAPTPPSEITLSVFPTPASESVSFRIRSLSAFQQPWTITLVDALGSNVAELHGISMSDDYECDISTASLPSGMYFIRVSQLGSTAIGKVIVRQ